MLTQPAPCHGCRHGKSCAELHLACEAYAAYQGGSGRRRWSAAPRVPRPSIYAAVFGPEPSAARSGPSPREQEVFELIGEGKSTRDIATQLGLSRHTVDTHRKKLRVKLALSNGRELEQAAMRWVIENR